MLRLSQIKALKNAKRKEIVSIFMPKEKKYQNVRGMRDILPEDQKVWQYVLDTARKACSGAGFSRIDTPIVESADLFKRGTGEDTDIITKEVYEFSDRSGDKLVLRPEFTPSIVRAYIQYGMRNRPQPVQLYTIGPFFRYDRPQAHRYRQAHQINAESIGDDDPIIDAQMVSLAFRILSQLKINNITIQINSIGCPKCRPKFKDALRTFYKPHLKSLCKDCKERYKKNPLRLLDCKEAKCQKFIGEAPPIVDSLCEECHNHFKQVLEYLDDLEIAYDLNTHLVRGLDYYTRTVFEITSSDLGGSQNSIGGGGRYDDLVKLLGGRDTPAVGFGMGIERTVELMGVQKISPPVRDFPDVFVVQLGDQAKRKVLKLTEDLRNAGLKVANALGKETIGAQLRLADKLRAPLALIIGQKEVLEGTVIIRDMSGGMQETVDLETVVTDVTRRLPKDTFTA